MRVAIGTMLAAGMSLVAVAGAAFNATQNSLICCAILKKVSTSSNQVVMANDASYPGLNSRWSDTASLAPTCIYLPATSDDVSTAVKVLVQGIYYPTRPVHHGLNYSCPFAIASGGSATGVGANDINGGIVIDLSLLLTVNLSKDKTVASIGAGASWPFVYDALKSTGRAVAGGDDTGVGGTALAGGISPFSSRVGLTVDNIINYEVVLASGWVVNVNASSFADLFQCLKGGGNNFGIVTRIDMTTFRNSGLWGGELVVPMNASGAVLQSLNYFVQHNAQDPDSGLRVTYSWNATAGRGKITNFLWNSHNARSQSSLTPFFDLAPQISKQLQNNVSLSQLFPAYNPRNVPNVHRSLFATVTVVNNNDTLFRVNQWTNAVMYNFNYLTDVEWRWSFDPLPSFYRNHGVNPLGLNYTQADLIVVSLNPHWTDPAHDVDVSKASQAWADAIQKETNMLNTSFPFEYLGYAAPFQNALASYGASNLQFLVKTAKTYDPNGVFQTLVPGGFKLNEANQ